MLKLHGFSASNYYSLAKLALLEKDIPFEEVQVYSGAGPGYREDYLQMSPMGKIPCLETEHGFVSESRCIIEYLDAVHPERPLIPQDPWRRAKHAEAYQFLELYLELNARRLIAYVLTGRPAPDPIKAEVKRVLDKAVPAMGQLFSFDRYLLGDELTALDLAATMHFPVVTLLAQGAFGEDPLAGVDGLAEYRARMEERPHVKRVRADSAEDMPHFIAHLRR